LFSFFPGVSMTFTKLYLGSGYCRFHNYMTPSSADDSK
jgi:hypothetical protein